MSWLFPLYLLGAAAIIAPILMHLRRRPPQNRVEFSSLMFLDAHTPVPIKNRRLEHWLLLLLRCLALVLLAFMFSRPWFRSDTDGDLARDGAVMVLLDRSASMRRGDLWQRAVSQTRQLVQNTPLTDRVAVAAFDRELQPVWTFDQDQSGAAARMAAITQSLEDVTPGWAATDLGGALVEALSWFSTAPATGGGVRKQIVVISDLQEGSKLDALRGIAWPDDVTVAVIRLDAANADNFSISLAASAASGHRSPHDSGSEPPVPGIRVRLANARESKASDFTLAWTKGGTEASKGYLPPGASRVMQAPPITEAGASRHEATVLQLSGDAWDFDNRVFLAPPQPRKVRIAWLRPETNRDEAASPLYYLTRALQPTETLDPVVEIIPPAKPEALAGASMAFLAGTGNAAIAAQRRWLEAGGLGIWVLSPETTARELEALSGVTGIAVREAANDDYRMLSSVKADHPLLRPFADVRLRDFTKLRFWHHRVISLSAEAAKRTDVIATFDNGDPAMLFVPQGAGSLLILSSGWHPADSQLALSTKFVPLLYGWLDAAGFAHDAQGTLLVGDALPLEAKTSTKIKAPDGQVIQAKPNQPVHAEQVGVYDIASSDSPPAVKLVAVNLPPEESRVSPLEPERLKEFGVKMESAATGAAGAQASRERERLASHEEEARQHGWWWVLLALLGVLVWETWLAGRTPRLAGSAAVQT